MCPHEVRVCEATLQLDSIVTENVDHILGDNNLGEIHGNYIPVDKIVG